MELYIWHQTGTDHYEVGSKSALTTVRNSIDDPDDLLILYKFRGNDKKLAMKIFRELNQASRNMERNVKILVKPG